MQEKFRDQVTAIVLSQSRDFPYLAQTLAAIAEQTHKPDRVIIGLEEEVELPFLQRALPMAEVHIIGQQPSLGVAVTTLLADAELTDTWLWVLHADSAPEPSTLDFLLRTGETSHQIGAVGPKQVSWEETPRHLLEVGINATRSARRVPEVEVGELDQGQLDYRTDVLAVGSAGMLVRTQAWQHVGGFDPHLGPFGDGLEFSRRLRLAGYRVVVEPRAAVRHAQMSLGQPLVKSFARRRSAQLYNALLAAPLVLVPFLWLGYVLGSIPRAFLRLLGQELAYARAELRAGWTTAGTIAAVIRGRLRIRAVRQVPRKALKELEAAPWAIQQAKRHTRRAHADARFMAQAPDQFTIKEYAQYRRVSRIGRVIVTVGALVLAGVLFIPVAFNGALSGGDLAYGSQTGLELIRLALSGWIPAGDGYPGSVDPLWVFIALPLTILQPFHITIGQLVTVVLYCALPLVALLAYAALGRVIVGWQARVVLTFVWLVSPPFLDALASGRIAGVVAYIGLTGCAYAIGGSWRGSLRDSGFLAFFAMVTSLASPIFALVIAVIGVGSFIWQKFAWRWIFIPLPVLIVHLPGLRYGGWRYLVTMPGNPVSAHANPVDVVSLVPYEVLSWNFPALLAYLLPLTVVVIAVIALGRFTLYGRIRLAWIFAIFGLIWALATTQIAFATVYLWAGFGQELAWVGLLMAIACGFAGTRSWLRSSSFGIKHLSIGLVGAVLCCGLIGTTTHFILVSSHIRQLHPQTATLLPAIGIEDQRGGAKVLSLEPTPTGIEAQLWRGYGIELTDKTMVAQARPADPQARDHLGQTVANIMGRSASVAMDLQAHGISLIVVPVSDDVNRVELVGALNALTDISYVSGHEAGDFWRVAPSQDEVVFARPGHPQHMSPSSTDRVIALGERFSPHWHAKVNGTELAGHKRDWQQAFILPAGSHGELTVDYSDRIHSALVISQLAIMIMAAIVAVPITRRRWSR